MKNSKKLVLLGLFIALNVVLTRIVRPIELPFLRVSFGFIATSLAAILLGPIYGGISAALADIIGFFLFPTGSYYFPGFTFSALLSGIIYGLFLKEKPASIIRTILAVLTITAIVDLGLNTLWLTMLYNKAFIVILPQRLIKAAIFLPVQVIIINILWKYIGKHLRWNE